MSDQEAKEKRSRRIQKEENAIRKQLKLAKTFHMDVKEHEGHRFAKHHALDCGVPSCPMCSSPRKLRGDQTIQEKSFYQKKLTEDSGED